MKVVLVFRDRRRKGKSIEGIFQSVLEMQENDVELIRWEYNDTRSLWWNLRQLKKLDADIVHITGDIMYLTNFLVGQTVVLTYHDIGRYKELTGIKKLVYKKFWIQWPVRIAKKVTTVSDFTKKDLINLLPHCSNKIEVVYNGVSSIFTFEPKSFNSVNPRLLQVGTAQNKNLETVIEAVRGLPLTLAIIGPLSEHQHKLIEQADVHFENYTDLKTMDLQKQYARCDIVVFISLHEGFGMPVIEAQQTGRVIITSAVSSLPEIAGNGAHFIKDPLSAAEIKKAIQKVICDSEYREMLIRAGRMNINRFSANKMREGYFQVYRQSIHL